MKKISVIIPAYNAKKYIEETIASVIDQTYQNFEVLVIDDGSTDNTASIIKNIDDKRIRYFFQENASQAVARNKGIEKSKGEFIAFLDADDLWQPEKLVKQLKLFDDEAVGLVYTGVEGINEIGNRKEIHKYKYLRGNILERLISNNFITCSSVMIRKSLLEDKQIHFRIGRQGVEDWDLWLRFAMICKFDFLEKSLVKYRIYQSSMSQNRDLMMHGIYKTLGDLREEVAESPNCSILNNLIDKSLSEKLIRYAHWLLKNRRKSEAINNLKKALRLDPINLKHWWGAAKFAVKY